MVSEISNKLRTLAKFTQSLKKPTLRSIQDLCFPETLLEEVKNQYLRNEKPSPTTAIKTSHNLEHCANVAIVEAIVKGNKSLREKFQDFLVLYKENYLSTIYSVAKGMVHEERFNKPIGVKGRRRRDFIEI